MVSLKDLFVWVTHDQILVEKALATNGVRVLMPGETTYQLVEGKPAEGYGQKASDEMGFFASLERMRGR